MAFDGRMETDAARKIVASPGDIACLRWKKVSKPSDPLSIVFPLGSEAEGLHARRERSMESEGKAEPLLAGSALPFAIVVVIVWERGGSQI